jgi:hypothetical protein
MIGISLHMKWPLTSQSHGSFLKENNWIYVMDQTPRPHPTMSLPPSFDTGEQNGVMHGSQQSSTSSCSKPWGEFSWRAIFNFIQFAIEEKSWRIWAKIRPSIVENPIFVASRKSSSDVKPVNPWKYWQNRLIRLPFPVANSLINIAQNHNCILIQNLHFAFQNNFALWYKDTIKMNHFKIDLDLVTWTSVLILKIFSPKLRVRNRLFWFKMGSFLRVTPIFSPKKKSKIVIITLTPSWLRNPSLSCRLSSSSASGIRSTADSPELSWSTRSARF